MTTVSDNEEIALLRAIAHARMYVTSGRGLESVAHAIAANDLGLVTKTIQPAIERMSEGEDAESALRSLIDSVDNTNLRAFYSAITATGKSATSRLDELSEQLHTERAASAEVQGERLTKLVDASATIFVLTFVPTIASVFGDIPENDVIPSLKVPWWFGPTWFAILAAVMSTMMLLARQK